MPGPPHLPALRGTAGRSVTVEWPPLTSHDFRPATFRAMAQLTLQTERPVLGTGLFVRASMRLSGKLDVGRLDLRVLVIGVQGLVASDAGLLVAAERHRDVAAIRVVDVDRTRPELARDAMGAVEIVGPERSLKPVDRVVGDAHGLFLVLEGDSRENRAEDFLLRNPHAVIDLVEDRRLDIGAAGVLAHLLAAESELRAFLPADLDIALH